MLRIFFISVSILLIAVLGYAAFLWFSLVELQEPKIPETVVLKEEISLEEQEIPEISVIAKNLKIPWAIAFLPDDNILVTERPGRLRFVDKVSGLTSEPIAILSDVFLIGEGGLLGLALHPDFRENSFLYLYYTYQDGGRIFNKVVRYLLVERKLIDPKVIIESIPGSGNHNGGRIKFGPDGFLYITTGDAQNPNLAQDISSLAGKILRVADDGSFPEGNPFPGSPVYSFGHRNPQGLAWDEKRRLFETEHGARGKDELNLVEPGKNYGWPIIQGAEAKDGMESPMLQSGTDIWAPAGTAWLNNSVFFGGLRGKALFEAEIKDGELTLVKHFSGQFGRLRDVAVGPDGALYITTSNRDGRGFSRAGDDKILRIRPPQ